MVGLLLQSQAPLEAEKHYLRALQLNPRAAVASANLAWLYAEQDSNLDVALQLAQTAKEQLPENPDYDMSAGSTTRKTCLGWRSRRSTSRSSATPAIPRIAITWDWPT